jgi:Protein of unknown function (DUF4012)
MTTTEVTPIRPEIPPARPRRRRRWLKRSLVVLLVVAGVLTLATIVTGLAAAGLRQDLLDGREAMERARDAISYGNLDTADAALEEAKAKFHAAAQSSHDGLAGIAGSLPVFGRTIDVAGGLAQAGERLATAGTHLVASIEDLPDGLSSLAPTQGALPVENYRRLGAALEDVQTEADAALALVRDTPSSLLAGPVADARFQAERQLHRATDAIESLRLTLDGLPAFAGAEGERQYFFAAESPAELRGTGGIWGAYSIVTVRDGSFRFSKFRPIQELPDLDPKLLPPPNPDYERNYDQYGGAGFWRNMNMTPDFPSAARAVLNAYEQYTGERLDGVITADPFALQSLLEVTGPTEVAGLGRQLDADSVVPFTTNEAYIRYRDPVERKAVLGDVAKGVFERFLAMDEHDVGRIRAIASSVAGGHLKVYTDTDEQLQDGLAIAGVDGAFTAAEPGDVLDVIVNSGSGSKVDYYATRRVSYDVQLGGDGEAIATTQVDIHNDAPSSGLPRYVITPLAKKGKPGDNISLVTISCAHSCELLTAERNGSSIGMRYGSELGLPRYEDFFTTPSGSTGTLRIQTKLDDVWEGNSSGGWYRLTYLNQTTVQPTHVTITIHAPAGQRIVWTSEPMDVVGDTATWTGTPGPRTEFEVRFEAPLPLRLWRDATRPLGS